jgi:type II secretory pathway component PulF
MPAMRTFVYEAIDRDCREVEDKVEAASVEVAMSKIRDRGHFPTLIREIGGQPWTAEELAQAKPIQLPAH